jgi:hypothetical protein
VSRLVENLRYLRIRAPADADSVTPITLPEFCHPIARRSGATANEGGVAIIEIARGKKYQRATKAHPRTQERQL